MTEQRGISYFRSVGNRYASVLFAILCLLRRLWRGAVLCGAERTKGAEAPLFTGLASLSSPLPSWLFAALADARSLKSPFRVRFHYRLLMGKNQYRLGQSSVHHNKRITQR